MTNTLDAALIRCATLILAGPCRPRRIECLAIFRSPNTGRSPRPIARRSSSPTWARGYGSRVTGAQVHNDPLTKVYPCRTIGYDWRLKGSCAGYGPDSYAPVR